MTEAEDWTFHVRLVGGWQYHRVVNGDIPVAGHVVSTRCHRRGTADDVRCDVWSEEGRRIGSHGLEPSEFCQRCEW